jgi:hypothetical protein
MTMTYEEARRVLLHQYDALARRGYDDAPIVAQAIDVLTLKALREEIRDALEGESNDAEHDALVSVAGALGIHYTPDLAGEVEDLGWPSVADDLRNGVPRATVLARLDKIPGGPDGRHVAELREMLDR